MYDGVRAEQEQTPSEHCTTSETPSSTVKECKALSKSIGNLKYEQEAKDGLEVALGDEAYGNVTKCYSFFPGPYGWCATCDYGVEKSDCPPPTSDANWGACSRFCPKRSKGEKYTSILQEVQLSTLSDRQCLRYGKIMKALPKIELCAGKKKQRPSMKVYRKVDRSYRLVKNATQTDEDDFVLGGHDSCKGDSGGPLFVWTDRGATLIGVVSRGKGCAGHNQAGIYTRITSKLHWIHKHIKDGNCEQKI